MEIQVAKWRYTKMIMSGDTGSSEMEMRADRHTETDAGVVESDVLIADGDTGIQRGRSAQVQRCMRV